MNFTSDNAYGISPQIMAAIAAANEGPATAYGLDELSHQAEEALSETFEREVSVFQVSTGTAANALAVAVFTPPYGAVLCHEAAHIIDSECGAPEFFSGGAKLTGIAGDAGKLDPDGLTAALARFKPGDEHHVQPAMLSLTQASEAGTVYSVAETAALADIAHARGLTVHMDGARFANALVSLDVSPAEATWRAGVDVLSFGATKNGAMAAEAVILFSKDKAEEILYRRKRAGHLVSKSRFIAAQLLAYLQDGHWLELARRANGLARRMAEGLREVEAVRIAWPVQANELFVYLPGEMDARLKQGGAVYHAWPAPEGSPDSPDSQDSADGQEPMLLARLVTSFATPLGDVDGFVDLVKRETGS